MPLRLARYGVPLAETAPAGLAAAGIEPALLPPLNRAAVDAAGTSGPRAVEASPVPPRAVPYDEQRPGPDNAPEAFDPEQSPWFEAPRQVEYQGGYNPNYDPQEQYESWYEEQLEAEQYELQQIQYEEPPGQPGPNPVPSPSMEETGSFRIPVAGGRTREMGEGGGPPEPTEEDFYQVFKKSIDGSYPSPGQLRGDVEATFGTALPQREAERMVKRFTNRHTAELQEDHIA
jgi:hypothetical protein